MCFAQVIRPNLFPAFLLLGNFLFQPAMETVISYDRSAVGACSFSVILIHHKIKNKLSFVPYQVFSSDQLSPEK
ncbi:unnamed protein product [Notodromas monacha]|uniref:Secreted protein n=1 Tax=Notodromas monacha TaxID=399045 RepID=A0A7R9GM52_9CRUS|nr:unnamed protein product [Notodromas monacha]CAG0925726.1 unnamed protein product [Notodromas monacha]